MFTCLFAKNGNGLGRKLFNYAKVEDERLRRKKRKTCRLLDLFPTLRYYPPQKHSYGDVIYSMNYFLQPHADGWWFPSRIEQPLTELHGP